MPKYQVLTPIEHDGTMYLPAMENAPKMLPGAGHAGMRPVDARGFIELTEDQAAPMIHGQVPLHQGKPDPVDGVEFRAKKAKKEKADADAKAAAEKAEYEEFQAFKAAKAAKSKK